MPTKRTPKQVSRVADDPVPRRPLAGTIAVVAGATRGAGRGIARALGEAGTTVYCTGRSMRGWPSPYNRPETIDETTAMINDAGGTAALEAQVAQNSTARGGLDSRLCHPCRIGRSRRS